MFEMLKYLFHAVFKCKYESFLKFWNNKSSVIFFNLI